MKVGLIRMRYTPFGGAEVFLERFIDGLVARGHSVELFSSDWPGREGVSLHRISVSGPSFLRPLVFARGVRKEVERVRPDVVVSFERTLSQDIYRAGDGCHREWLRRKKAASPSWKRPLIMLNPLHHVLLYLEKRLFADVRKVVANSKRGKEEIMRLYGLPEERICVIYNGINLGPFDSPDASLRVRARKELGIPEGSTVLLFVGSGFERKGLLYLIRALKLLRGVDPGVRLIVVGKGRSERYEREARLLGVSDALFMAGPQRDVLKFYAASDVFVLPSIYEPFSNACLEAMASGLPVVTSRTNGASEVVRDSFGAVIEDPTDEREVAQMIRPFLSKERREKAGGAARLEARKYPIERNVDEFLRLVESLP